MLKALFSCSFLFQCIPVKITDRFPTIFAGIIGYAPTFNKILNFEEVGNTDDDQLYYTRIYLKHRVGE